MPRGADLSDMALHLDQVMTLATACADDLEDELRGRHVGDHPVTLQRLAADLEVVRNLRAALDALRSIREGSRDPADKAGHDGLSGLFRDERKDPSARDPEEAPRYGAAPSQRGGHLLADGSLDPDMSPEALRLRMGDLTPRQIETVRAAIRWTNASAAMDADARRTAAAAASWARHQLRIAT